MSATAPNAPLRYRGYNSQYVDIAVRGADEHLGLAIEYAAHPSNIGCFILRFIVHGKGIDPKNYTHLTYRESAKFIIPASESNPTAEIFKGLRLTKVAIPVFKPAIQRHEVAALADKNGGLIWAQVANWVAEQVAAEGFTLTVSSLKDEVRGLVALPVTSSEVEVVLDFPKLDAPEQKAAALKLVKTPEPEETDEEDGEESDDKEWLN